MSTQAELVVMLKIARARNTKTAAGLQGLASGASRLVRAVVGGRGVAGQLGMEAAAPAMQRAVAASKVPRGTMAQAAEAMKPAVKNQGASVDALRQARQAFIQQNAGRALDPRFSPQLQNINKQLLAAGLPTIGTSRVAAGSYPGGIKQLGMTNAGRVQLGALNRASRGYGTANQVYTDASRQYNQHQWARGLMDRAGAKQEQAQRFYDQVGNRGTQAALGGGLLTGGAYASGTNPLEAGQQMYAGLTGQNKGAFAREELLGVLKVAVAKEAMIQKVAGRIINADVGLDQIIAHMKRARARRAVQPLGATSGAPA